MVPGEVLNKEIAKDTDLKVSFGAGKVKLELVNEHASGSVAIVVEQDAGYFLDKLAKAIPGEWDDLPIALLKEKLKQS